MNTLRSLAALAAIPAVVLLASSCAQRDNAVAPNLGTPSFHFNVFTCTGFKMTGGGRIDFPPGTADKNPPASHEYETFGAHVIAEPNGQTDELGHCEGAKGSLEWVDHRPEYELNGRPLNLHSIDVTWAELATDTDCEEGGVHWGGTLVIKNTGQQSRFEVFDCDNGEPGAGHDGFGIRLWDYPYEVLCMDPELPPAEPSCTLTGGNRQFHPTH